MSATPQSILQPPVPRKAGQRFVWGQLYGDSQAAALGTLGERHDGLVLIVTPDSASADQLNRALSFFKPADLPVLHFPDWETLPYDVFSPHQDIVSERLSCLTRLRDTQRGLLVVPAGTLLHRLAPRSYLDATVFDLKVGDRLDTTAMRDRLTNAGYRSVAQVAEHGEFAVRGELFDLFPMGANKPYRIDLFDDEIESIRSFDAETQLSEDKVERLSILPGREFPSDDEAIRRFRQNYRLAFDGDPNRSLIYKDVSAGLIPGGIEYYLPLFFEDTASFFDYLPDNTLAVFAGNVSDAVQAFSEQTRSRYDERCHDIERPILEPEQLFVAATDFHEQTRRFARIDVQSHELSFNKSTRGEYNFASKALPILKFNARAEHPAAALQNFIDDFVKAKKGRILFTAESPGRREILNGLLKDNHIAVSAQTCWAEFETGSSSLGLAVAPLELGLRSDKPLIAVVTEAQLLGDRAGQARRQRRRKQRDADAMLRDLTELRPDAPVVHEDHGVGRYLGLTKMDIEGVEAEFLTLEYAGGDKLYVPVASLHLISRYTGADADKAPVHKLGSDHWEKIKRKAAEKVRDVAAELLELYAKRESRPGHETQLAEAEYHQFAADFPFEETPDQANAIDAVIADLRSDQTMDRVVCGDVGFGKTEVAMRAAFVAAQDGGQVAILVPTTLLAQQHFQNLQDRFADWPIRIEGLSRFTSKKQQDAVMKNLESGEIDIVVGTHKLLSGGMKFKDLRLVIIDEEQRFGVRQKEQLKKLRAEVDLLTLTATPIPRTLNMALSGLRDLSIIATPPTQRHAIKTFVSEWNGVLIKEAILRELRRGGQVYFLHNEVESIERIAREVGELVPEARIDIAHGQMRERELERVMLDFYHRRANVLVCTTIIESGIDVPNANTIVINRADKLGLSQLHQIRGRVGRSHHRAYAYLIRPNENAITADAKKRLAAIESMEDLGAGFNLAQHDLEIRGAGELLGDDQSGQIQEIGYGMYIDLLNRTVEAMKSGETPELTGPAKTGIEVDLHIPALLPDDFVPDVHTRLVLYKRIANALDHDQLKDLQIELIDRFGLLPDAAKNLFEVTAIKIDATPLGIKKIDVTDGFGRFVFSKNANIDAGELIKLIQTRPSEFKLDGQEKMRFFTDMPDAEDRILTVRELIGLLTPEGRSD